MAVRTERPDVSEEPPLKERIVEVLATAPDDDASVATVRGLLAREEGVRPAFEDLQDEMSQLLDEGRVEVVRGEGDDPRYRLVDDGY